MTAYRFRVKLDADPSALWQDIVGGGDRTIAEFQSVEASGGAVEASERLRR